MTIAEKYWSVISGPPRDPMVFRLNETQFRNVIEHRYLYLSESNIDPLKSFTDLTGAVVGIDVSEILRYYQMSQNILEIDSEYEKFEKSHSESDW